MKAITIKNPITKELILFEIFSFPKEGPTKASDIILVSAGNFPISRILAKSCASWILKFPVICVFPPVIGSFTLGADTTSSSSKIATWRLLSCAALVVISAQALAPFLSILRVTPVSFVIGSGSAAAATTWSPDTGASALSFLMA